MSANENKVSEGEGAGCIFLIGVGALAVGIGCIWGAGAGWLSFGTILLAIILVSA
jgi:hypothetical protein